MSVLVVFTIANLMNVVLINLEDLFADVLMAMNQ